MITLALQKSITKLLDALMSRPGQTLTVNELAEMTNLAPNTINQYLSPGRYQKYFHIDKTQGKALRVGLPNYKAQREALKEVIFWRDGNSCIFCRKQVMADSNDADITFLTPKSKKGKAILWNLGASCKSCQSAKGGQTAEEFLKSIPKKKQTWVRNQIKRIRSLETGKEYKPPEPSMERIVKQAIQEAFQKRQRWEYDDVLIDYDDEEDDEPSNIGSVNFPSRFNPLTPRGIQYSIGNEEEEQHEEDENEYRPLKILGPEEEDWDCPVDDNDEPLLTFLGEVANYYEEMGWETVSVTDGEAYDCLYVMLVRRAKKG